MFSLYINNTSAPNKYVDSNGSTVRINLDPPIILDPKKKYQLRVLQANVVYCEPNVTSQYTAFSYVVNGTTYNKTIPVGVYGIAELNTTINNITNAVNNAPLFKFAGDASTSKTIVYFSQPNTYINCLSNRFMSLLGFPSDGEQIGGGVSANLSVTSPQQAVLNNLQLILVTCNITTGSYLNSNQNNIISGIPINVNPFSQLQREFIHPTKNNIFVNRIDVLEFSLLSQDGNALDFTLGDIVSE